MHRFLLATLAAGCLLTTSLQAESKIGFRQLGSTKPVVVERGKKTTIQIRSSFTLDGTHSVFFDKPGITMKFLETKPIAAPRTGRGRTGTPFRFECNVPADQEPGIYEMRVATKQAVSSITHLLVSEYPVVLEAAKENGTPANAQSVPVPVAISGVCEKAEDVDCFAVNGKAGQELTFQIYAQRVTQAVHSMQSGGGVYLMDPILTLFGPNGQVVAQNDNFIGGDSFLAFKLPEDGTYVLEVRDARYIGNDKYVYCVEISDRPFAHAVFPIAVQSGKPTEVSLVGHNLGTSPSATITIGISNPSASDETHNGATWKTFRFRTPLGETNPVPILVSQSPQLMASTGNDSIANAIPLTLPVGVNARFSNPEQSHYYSFDAVKGKYYLFEIIAHRSGLPLDCVLEIQDETGKKLAEADDGLQTKDPKLYFKAPADGKLFVVLRDLHDRGGERFFYHLKAEPSGPDFEVHGEYYYAQIAPGTRMVWFAKITRLNGFKGPVEMHVDGLPKGVSVTPVTIPAGMTYCSLLLSAAPDAKVNASLARVYGKATIADTDDKPQEVIRYGRITCELQTQGGGQARWPISTQLVGVTEPLDLLKVEATPSELTLKPGGKAEITVRIERSKGYKDPVTLAMAFKYFSTTYGNQLPPGVTVSKSSKARLTGNVLEGKIILEATDKAMPVERLPISVLARVSITFSITTNYGSNPVYLTIPAPAEVTKK